MGFPVIKILSTTGNDSNSGAGPGDGVTSGTVLSGSSGVTANNGASVAGRRVNLDGSPDLTNVATDGTHTICFNDTTTTNGRMTAAIEGKGNSGTSSAYVDVAQGLGVATATSDVTGTNGVTASWRIGGIKASLGGSTSSLRLFTAGTGNGDAMPGWKVEPQPNHAETYGSAIAVRRSGDTTSGPITIGGTGSGTLPVITVTGNNGAFSLQATMSIVISDLEFKNTSATKTTAPAIHGNGIPATVHILRCRCADSSAKCLSLVDNGSGLSFVVEGCEISTSGAGINSSNGANGYGKVINNYIHDCGGSGIQGNTISMEILGNLIVRCTDGVQINTTTTTNALSQWSIVQNTIDSCSGSGVNFAGPGTGTYMLRGLFFVNNQLTNNGAYGVNFSGSGFSLAATRAYHMLFRGNNIYGNASGSFAGFTPDQIDGGSSDPGYTAPTLAGGDNFATANSQMGEAYPSSFSSNIGTKSGTKSYASPGAAQSRTATSYAFSS